ncbi:hypothetical protein VCUG_00522 [Vavraia culicis subsp. floridensis]|uniref:Uncharacterized protein n=1 Tax=Vavraia culicis (isolate floridensis) TaxID=948595 RepID=L2GWE1_VAVCU|nr:uncharacterized protein VCUG_00522 [Vavraia culicis subsp. floridensis]ELA47939.1 hypothetical protein VCUG_00522 [Vavraia culicis subsp. floridensis]
MAHVPDRSKIFKEAFKKMINETFKDKERINRLMADKESVNSSCMFSEVRMGTECEHGLGCEKDGDRLGDENGENDENNNENENGENNNENDENNNENDENDENNSVIYNNPTNHITSTNLITILKHNLSQSFKTLTIHSNTAPSLSNLSNLINQHIINRRDIRNEEYIREVFSSYSAQHKRVLVSRLSAMIEDMKGRVVRMKERVSDSSERMRRVDDERSRVGERYVGMYKRFSDVMM